MKVFQVQQLQGDIEKQDIKSIVENTAGNCYTNVLVPCCLLPLSEYPPQLQLAE